MLELFNTTCQACSQLITQRYSTSFSMGIRAFDEKIRMPIYAIYGFVRFADEIVDTFHGYPKADLLRRFREDACTAIREGISLNPVLHAFQEVVNRYQIEQELIDCFLDSMEMDLHHSNYASELYEKYIYGSAEVVGLMCLRVFCEGDRALYDRLKSPAQSLGAAFQKINFMRDLKSDFDERGRVYFPGIDFSNFTTQDKLKIETEIKKDFEHAYIGIVQLPKSARFGVYLAYVYYLNLFKKIRSTAAAKVKEHRIRVNDGKKIYLLCSSAVRMSLNIL